MKKLLQYKKTIAVLLGLVFLLTFLVKKRHADNGDFNWRGEIWADQAGYYVYLPSLFIYKFDVDKMDSDIADKTGNGFSIDTQNKKVLTKYTCGVAILQAPVFLVVHLYEKIRGRHTNGFADAYHNIPNFCAILYTALALILLFYFLKNYFSPLVSIATIATLFLGTNLYYYAIDHTGMSHIYSFFMFTLVLNLTRQLIYGDENHKTRNFVFWCLSIALIILIRPTNIIFAGLVFLLDCNSYQAVVERFKAFLNPKFVLIGLACLFLVFLPQLLYWRYSSGSMVHYSYGDEGFTNWSAPKLLDFWFAPNNGLLLYSPLLILVPFVSIVMLVKKVPNGLSAIVAFLLLSYVSASWYIVSFGCGFGARNFVEYSALFALPFGYLITWASQKNYSKYLVGLVLIVGIFITQKLIFTYDKCFFGANDWDWSEYKHLLKRGYHHTVATIENNKTDAEFIGETIIKPDETFTFANYERVWLQTYISSNNFKKKTCLVIETHYNNEVVQWQEFEIKNKMYENDKITRVIMDFSVKKDVPNSELSFKAYIWNPSKAKLEVQKFEVFMK